MGLGASSTSALASLRPSPVAARTTLMTWIFLSPGPVRTTSTVVDSSSAAAASPPPPAAGAPPGAPGARGGGRRGDRRRRDAELLLERLDALGQLEHRDALQLFDPLFSRRHRSALLCFFLVALGGRLL